MRTIRGGLVPQVSVDLPFLVCHPLRYGLQIAYQRRRVVRGDDGRYVPTKTAS
jgi:hypothetical protein